MSDANRDLVDLRKEVVEARNQAIKTDNQLKNLSLDIKGFDRRFEGLERRAKIASIGANAIVAVAIFVATYMVHTVRLKSVTSDLQEQIKTAEAEKVTANKVTEQARTRAGLIEDEKHKREKAATAALKLVEHLDAKRDKEAVDLLESVDLAALTPLESRLLEKRVGDLRASASEAAYKLGRQAYDQKRGDLAVTQLKRSMALDPEARFAGTVRYLLATQLAALKRHEEAEPIFREIMKLESDRAVVDEIRYLLGVSLAAMNRHDEAKATLTEVQQRGGRFGGYARDQLEKLEAATQQTATAAATPAAAPAAAPHKPAPKPTASNTP